MRNEFEKWMTGGSSLTQKIKQGSFGLLALSMTYAASFVHPGWGSYLATFPALSIIAATSLVRIVDMQGWEIHHAIRRTGFLMVLAFATAIAVSPFTDTPTFPTWTMMVGCWGLAGCWLTTPNMPPWWKWVSGQYKYKDPRMV